MMRIRVLLFATLRDQVGTKTLELDVPVDLTVDELKKILVGKYPRLEPTQNHILAAINGEFASELQQIPQNSEIALFPPVSGG
jgi:molybdopterin converting factor subunit 1